MDFSRLLEAQRGEGFERSICTRRIVGIDPGETTGICTFEGSRLLHADQLKTNLVPEGAARVLQYIISWQATLLVMEEYRVYAWKTRQHAWAGLHTPRLIGALEYISSARAIPMIVQSAGEGKAFCTNEKLQEWGMYQTSMRHANDAVRHVCHALLFQKGLS